MFSSVVVILITIFYLAFLELSKNTIPGWCIGIVAAVFMVMCLAYMHKKHYPFYFNIIAFAVFFVILALNANLTKPLPRRINAVDYDNPEETKVVHTKKGDIKGVYTKDHKVRIYAGIPYAKPPVGELRFRLPEDMDEWEGVKTCDKFGPMAMQPSSGPFSDALSQIFGYHEYKVQFGDEYTEKMSEDCLYLNVFAPDEDTQNSNEKLPVIMYIHGGSLSTGQSYYINYRGESFAKKKVIFVSIGYRLGVFGYYVADDLKKENKYNSSGNYGLCDQIKALEWIRDNIEAFGGDKDKITIAGESAGSSSVNAICASSLAKGMFRYAIGESSSVVAKKPYHTFIDYKKARDIGAKVREKFGVKNSDELRKIPAEKLVEATSDSSAMTVDGYALVEEPYKTYEKGENNEQALLHGFNAKESDVFMLNTKATKDNYRELVEKVVGNYADKAIDLIPADYPMRDEHILVDALGSAKGAVNTLYSAAWFSYSHHVWNKYMVAQNKPSYEYYFSKKNKSLSNYHSGELPYVYGNLWRHQGIYDEDDYELSEIMQQYWVNFVKTGNPNANGLVEWKMRDKNNTKLLELNTDIKMIGDPNEEIYKIIDEYQQSQE
ncbi:carboxylesterase/lipase family protein [Butyrivibrio sp. NC3005]|uniref:carboxylesterase/lipase family protein n=1 Tax=Butyrivibrio sp. NC3005 TaxID=1280685 RepID=UPI0004048C0A|nr:carboxylesterase family protein [Butyrivibrio sp. NC3005]